MSSDFKNKRIILASASPRRRELLSMITNDFEIVTADVDERSAENQMAEEGVSSLEVSERLALLKAGAVFEQLTEEEKKNSVVIGADTSVILDDVIYGKPADRDDAYRMLSSLSGHVHVVATGVAIYSGSLRKSFTEETRVEFYELDEQQESLIAEYCDSNEPYDKAGAYAIQGKGALLVKKIDGDNSNVIGLPVARLARELTNMVK